MPEIHISDTGSRMGRPLQWPEKMVAAFARGVFARIAAALRAGEDRTDFVREAVEKELKRRERGLSQGPKVPPQS